MNLANKLTLSRLFFAIVIFAILQAIVLHERSETPPPYGLLGTAALVLFVAAAATDTLDGHIARKYRLSTAFGRMADPLMDKIVICGTLVFLVQIRVTRDLVPAWVVVVVLIREFLVTGLRGIAESRGTTFAASLLGKAKMILQSVLVGYALLHLAWLADTSWSASALTVLLWLTLAATALSGAAYLVQAGAILREADDI
jgi:CDP-diacylglycerol--glycerol-3-phosphate 3-phosphatidyltransferase